MQPTDASDQREPATPDEQRAVVDAALDETSRDALARVAASAGSLPNADRVRIEQEFSAIGGDTQAERHFSNPAMTFEAALGRVLFEVFAERDQEIEATTEAIRDQQSGAPTGESQQRIDRSISELGKQVDQRANLLSMVQAVIQQADESTQRTIASLGERSGTTSSAGGPTPVVGGAAESGQAAAHAGPSASGTTGMTPGPARSTTAGTAGGRNPAALVLPGWLPGGWPGLLAVAGAVVVIGSFLFFGGGDGASDSGQSDGLESSGSSSSGSSGASGSASSGSSSGSSGGAVATTAPTACELRREEPLILEVSSPDITGGVIPEQYLRRNAYDHGFPTPSFTWSAVPPEATAVVIAIFKLEDDEFAEFQIDPDLRSDAFRRATERWTLTGLDPSLNSLPNTSLAVPPPAGAIEQTNQGPGVTPNGVASRSKFVGPGFPEQHFLFAVFALCEGDGTDRGLHRGFALAEDAAAYGWFFGEPPW